MARIAKQTAGGTADRTNRRGKFDRLLLGGVSLALAILLVAAFWYGISPAWVFAIGSGAIFVPVVGWGYRNKFNSPAVVLFFLVWLVIHVAVLLIVLAYLGFFYYIPVVILELWTGYTIAIWRFGPPEKPTSL